MKFKDLRVGMQLWKVTYSRIFFYYIWGISKTGVEYSKWVYGDPALNRKDHNIGKVYSTIGHWNQENKLREIFNPSEFFSMIFNQSEGIEYVFKNYGEKRWGM